MYRSRNRFPLPKEAEKVFFYLYQIPYQALSSVPEFRIKHDDKHRKIEQHKYHDKQYQKADIYYRSGFLQHIKKVFFRNRTES